MENNKAIGYIENIFDILIKADAYGVEKYAEIISRSPSVIYDKIQRTENHIAHIMRYDYTNMNTEYWINRFGKESKRGIKELKNSLNSYIAMQDKSLWEVMSFAGAPSAEELISHVIEKYRPELAACCDKNTNDMQATFKGIYLSSVKKMWTEKWEDMCVFRAKLYDVHNKLTEVSKFSSKESAIEFADRRVKKNPNRYNRYVVCLRSPFDSEHDAIYDIKGRFTHEYICTDQKSAEEWKVDYYDGSDHVIGSYTSALYIDGHCLYRGLEDNNAMYGVISYRKSLEEDYFVQYFKTYKRYRNCDVVNAIEKHIIEPNEMNIFDDFPAELYRSEEWKAVFYDSSGHEAMAFQSPEKFGADYLYTNMTSSGFAEYILFHRNSSDEDFSPVYKDINKDLL